MKNKTFLAALILITAFLTGMTVSCGVPRSSGQQPADSQPPLETVDTDNIQEETVPETDARTDPPCAHGHTFDTEISRVFNPTCFRDGAAIYKCSVCHTQKELVIPALTHEFQDGYCIHCGLNQGAETRFTYRYNQSTNSYILDLPKEDAPGEPWDTKETIILPTVGQDEDHGVRPVTGFIRLFANNTTIQKVIIPEGYTTIGKNAFSGNCTLDLSSIQFPSTLNTICDYAFCERKDMTEITIPDTITTIGDHTFSGCTNLSKITFPDGLTDIGEYAFTDCTSLTEIILPDSLAHIRSGAFSRTGLTSIEIPAGVHSLNSSLFWGCNQLTSVKIPDTVTFIGQYCFTGTNIPELTLPSSLTRMAAHAIVSCNVRKIVFKDGLTKLDDSIHDCPELETVVLPQTLTTMSAGEFSGCPNLKSINFPASFQRVPETLLTGCTKLTEILVDPDNPCLENRDGLIIWTEKHRLMCITAREELIIPDDGSVTEIATDACRNSNLVRVVIPGTVDKIYYNAFYNCRALESVEIGEGVRFFGNYSFANCTSLTSFTFPKSATSVGAFVLGYCTALQEVTIPRRFNRIPRYDNFESHSALFCGCTSLQSVYYDGTVHDWIIRVKPNILECGVQAGDYIVYCTDGEYDYHHTQEWLDEHT